MHDSSQKCDPLIFCLFVILRFTVKPVALLYIFSHLGSQMRSLLPLISGLYLRHQMKVLQSIFSTRFEVLEKYSGEI